MIFDSYKGTFRARKPHDWDKEKSLQDEMQELADLTAGSEGSVRTFNMLVQMGVDALNKKHQNIKRDYEVHFINAGAIIYVNEYKFLPDNNGTSFNVLTTIGDYAIMHPS